MIHGSWYKARIALQLLAEERVGAPMRAEAAAAKAREDAGFDALRAAVGAPAPAAATNAIAADSGPPGRGVR